MSPTKERLIPIRLPPGVYKNGTRNQARGRWFDSNCVRWYEGIMGPIGGWRNVQNTTGAWAASTAYAINTLIWDSNGNVEVVTHAGTSGGSQPSWPAVGAAVNDNGINWLNLGPTGNSVLLTPVGFKAVWSAIVSYDLNFYIVDSNGNLQQVTTGGTSGASQPVWNTTVGGTTTDGGITWTNRGAPGWGRGVLGYHVNPGTVSYMISGTNTRLYSYTTGAITDITPSGLVVANKDSQYSAGGYGTGPYGRGPYGTGLGASSLTPAGTWQIDNFGNQVIACLTSDGKLWGSPAAGPGAMTQITNAPVSNVGVVVTPERFLVALGAGGDGRKVQWADQNTTTIWGLGQGNDNGVFGSFFLSTKGALMSGRRARLQTFLWTDFDAYTMTFTGSSFGTAIYQFAQLGDNCGLIGANACVVLGNVAYWWSNQNKFFVYDGALSVVPCDVIDFLTTDLNLQQKAKIFAITNAAFDEVTWFYPSVANGTLECDSYVTYNFRLKCWYTGRLGIETGNTATRFLGRVMGVDKGTFDLPVYVDSLGYLWEHEIANARTNVGLVFADSGPISISDVDIGRMYGGSFDVAHIGRYIPDEKTLGDTQLTLFGNMLLTDPEYSVGPFAAAAPTQLRFLARNFRVRVQEKNAVLWRVGVPMLGSVPGGRR